MYLWNSKKKTNGKKDEFFLQELQEKKTSYDEGNGVSVFKTTVIYRNGYRAIDNASFQIPQSTIAALVGMNGSGKSTMLKSIMGLVPISTGRIRVLGLSIKQAICKNLVSYVPQAEEVDWNFPVLVKDVVMMGRYSHMGMMRIPRKIDYDIVSEALLRVEMDSLGTSQIGELSGGQKKRVFLARALAQKSQLILLDEPFTGIDLKTEKQIIILLKQLCKEGCTILVTTHNLGSVPEFCNHTVLVKGTVLASGLTEKIFTIENLEKTFDGMLHHFFTPLK